MNAHLGIGNSTGLGNRRRKLSSAGAAQNSSLRSRNRKNGKLLRNRVSYSMKAWGFQRRRKPTTPRRSSTKFRGYVDRWRSLRPNQWQVTPETARLLEHWRHHEFSDVRPFFCQVEAVETAIWLTEVAGLSKNGQRVLDHLAAANRDANPELMRLALKLATGAGKTTVMAMIIAWQTLAAERAVGP